jgi:hypothetical protein
MVGALDESDRHSQRGEKVVNRPINPRDIEATATQAPVIGSRAVTSGGGTGRPTDLIEKGGALREFVV